VSLTLIGSDGGGGCGDWRRRVGRHQEVVENGTRASSVAGVGPPALVEGVFDRAGNRPPDSGWNRLRLVRQRPPPARGESSLKSGGWWPDYETLLRHSCSPELGWPGSRDAKAVMKSPSSTHGRESGTCPGNVRRNEPTENKTKLNQNATDFSAADFADADLVLFPTCSPTRSIRRAARSRVADCRHWRSRGVMWFPVSWTT